MGYNKSDFYESSGASIPVSELAEHNNDPAAHPALKEICDSALKLAESAEHTKNKNAPGGYAGLNAEGKLLFSLLPVITEKLLGKGAVTAEKLSEDVLALFNNYVKKDGSKGLSSNDFTDEQKAAVGQIDALLKIVDTINKNYTSANVFSKHASEEKKYTDEQITALRKHTDSAVESAREYAEQQAKMATNSPYIGENGHWYIYDTETGAYIDSGVNATPKPDVVHLYFANPPEMLSVNTIYDLAPDYGELVLNLPAGQYGDFIQVDFTYHPGITSSISITSASGMSDFDLVPESGMMYSLYFDWGQTHIDDEARVQYGWRIAYSEYKPPEV